MKQLDLCWTMYSGDNSDYLVPNWVLSSSASPPEAWVGGNMKLLPDATNVVTVQNSRLYAYSASPAIYQCPSARPPSVAGANITPVRTVSLNGRMGAAAGGDSSSAGPLNTTAISVGVSGYDGFKKQSSIRGPSPSDALTFIDESINTIDDGIFYTRVIAAYMNIWVNSPSVRHGQSTGMSFADGHSERWRWKSLNVEQSGNTTATAANTPDLNRLQAAVYVP